MENLHLLFNKTMYDGIRYSKQNGESKGKIEVDCITESINTIKDAKFCVMDRAFQSASADMHYDSLYMKTGYPGLTAGVGYQHDTDSKDDVKLGFSFDYVSGQPYIPGSSVKGVMRHYLEKNEVFEWLMGDSKSKADVIKKVFDENGVVFLDAVIAAPDKNGKIIGNDYITPHKDELKNPTPLQFIKILPDVYVEFRVIFSENEYIQNFKTDLLTAFEQILEYFGIGAKTNVGYGNLTAVEEDEAKKRLNLFPDFSKELKSGTEYVAEIIKFYENKKGLKFCNLSIDGITEYKGKRLSVAQNLVKNKKIGDTIKVRFDGEKNEYAQFYVL